MKAVLFAGILFGFAVCTGCRDGDGGNGYPLLRKAGPDGQTVAAAGDPAPGFGSQGVVLSNEGSQDEWVAQAVVDGPWLYVAGTVGPRDQFKGNCRWRVEKFDLETGAKDLGFATRGEWTWDPTFYRDRLYGIVVSDGAIYLAGSVDLEFSLIDEDLARVVLKLDAATGIQLAGNVVQNDIVLIYTAPGSEPSSVTTDDEATCLTLKDGVLAVGGYSTPARNGKTGLLVYPDGTTQIISEDPWSEETANHVWKLELYDAGTLARAGMQFDDPSIYHDEPARALHDDSGIYFCGFDKVHGPDDSAWRVEKRRWSDLALDGTFGIQGIATSNPRELEDRIYSACLAGDRLWVSGQAERIEHGTGGWRIECWDSGTGARRSEFGTGGILEPGTEGTIYAVVTDGAVLYAAGAHVTDLGDLEWQLDKRDATTGSSILLGVSGNLREDPSARTDLIGALVIDEDRIVMAGISGELVADPMWRLKKILR